MKMGRDQSSAEFVGAYVNASQDAPYYLSQGQTKDAIDQISRASGRNKRISRELLGTVLPNGTLPTFITPENEASFLNTDTKFILSFDGDDEL